MTKIIWKELYTDLPTHVAEALRAARMKPEQIVVKEDGELMAIEGITEKDVESIRLLYNTDTVKDAALVIPSDLSAVAECGDPSPFSLAPAPRLHMTHLPHLWSHLPPPSPQNS